MSGLAVARRRLGSSSGRNLIANYVNIVAYTIAGFVVQPFLLGALGSSLYGAWRTVQRLTEIAVAADGQAYQSLKWVVASEHLHSSRDQNQRNVVAALCAAAAWVPALAFVVLGLLWAFPNFAGGLNEAELRLAALALGISCVPLLLGGALLIPDAVLVGIGQGYRSMGLTTTTFLVASLFAIVAAVNGGGIVGVAAAYAAGAVLNGLATAWVARQYVPWWGWSWPGAGLTWRLLRLGGWSQVWSVATRLMLSSDILVVGALMGSVVVAEYSFTSYVLVAAAAVGVLTTSAFTPQIGRAVGARDAGLARSLVVRVRQLNAGIATLIALGAIFFNETFVSLWVGDDQYLGHTTNLLCVVAFLQLAHIRSDGQIQDVTLRLRGKSLIGLAAATLSPVCAWALFTLNPGIDSVLLGLVLGRGVAWLVVPMLLRDVTGGLGWPLALQAVSIGSVVLASLVRTSLDGHWGALTSAWIVLSVVPSAMMLRAVRGRKDVIDA